MAMSLGDDKRKEMPQGEVIASWYGEQHHGRPTASGERFDRGRLTAAHPWLPFGTVLRVMNANDGRFVYVKINDRGSFHADREIDLSEAAANRIGIKGRGEGGVFIDVALKAELAQAREMMREAAKEAAQDGADQSRATAEKIARVKRR